MKPNPDIAQQPAPPASGDDKQTKREERADLTSEEPTSKRPRGRSASHDPDRER